MVLIKTEKCDEYDLDSGVLPIKVKITTDEEGSVFIKDEIDDNLGSTCDGATEENHQKQDMQASSSHYCKLCAFQTTSKTTFYRHMMKHPDAKSKHEYNTTCVLCKKIFNTKLSLDDHLLKKHTEYEDEVTSKIHLCEMCDFKTTFKSHFDGHMLQHYGGKYKTSKCTTCIHCQSTYGSKRAMDEHILRKHSEYTASITSKIHECETCAYKTTMKDSFDRHVSQHSRSNYIACSHCKALFRNKKNMENHILRDHPEFCESVVKKLFECEICTYKTSFKSHLHTHMFNHVS